MGAEHDAAFTQVKTSIAQKLKLAHLKDEYTVYLFSNASETHWASVLTQVPKEQMSLEIEKQDHEPLAFLSGSFSEASANWSIVEKEAFALAKSMTKLHYITSAREIVIVSRVRGRETSMVQGRDARLVAMDCERSRRSGAGSDKPKREVNTPNFPRRAGNAQKQQTQALLTPINNGCQDYMANANEGWEQPLWKP